MNNIGEKIAELRRERKMTQEELAGVIGVSAQTVSKWENNVTMPDILLLPIIAGIFEVTVDELFSLAPKPQKQPAPLEETPLAVYDAVLETMWAWDIESEDVNLRDRLSQNPKQRTGFVSMVRGGVYADKDIALTYVADPKDSPSLLENEEAAAFLRTLADPDVRKILRYLQENRSVACTFPSVGAKCGIPEENARNALEALVRYNLSQKQTIDMGTGERIDVYSHWGTHKFPLLIYPLLTLAERLSDFQENWCGFRC